MKKSRATRTTGFVLLILAVLGGCSRSAGNGAAEPGTADNTPPGATVGVEAAWLSLAPRETWEVHTMQGSRVGYGRTTVSRIEESGRPAVRIEAEQVLATRRFGQSAQQRLWYVSVETPEGRLIRFDSELGQGPSPQRCRGTVEGDVLAIETTTQGKTTRETIPWPPDARGFYATEASLLGQPMRPGERRRLKALIFTLNQLADVELSAADYEPVDLPGGADSLLRVEAVTRFADGQTLPMTLWCDRTGDILRSRVDMMGLETLRATKEAALEKTDAPALDLGWDVVVKVDRAIPRPHATRRVRYRVELPDGDPSSVFCAGPTQKVRALGPHEAEITVEAIRPADPPSAAVASAPGRPPAEEPSPAPADSRANNHIQSDHPKIVELARRAAGDERDPWRIAVRLERCVHDLIAEKNFSQAFATAAEVIEKPEGDCTEHAVLLAALCRAVGIPARVAVGLVYLDRAEAFGYHMWTEAWIDGRWIPLDATLGQGGIGAAHLKIGQSSLDGGAAYTAFLPVVRVLGKLKITVEEVEGE